MEKKAFEMKAAITAFFTVMGSLLGWFGIMVLVLAGLAALDYATGSIAAKRAGQWTSRQARDGIWHKGGMLAVIAVAGAADLVLGLMLNNMPYLTELGFVYTILFCPVVVVWYIFTEMGSILENVTKFGSACPPFLQALVDMLKVGIVEYVTEKLKKKE